MSAVRAAAHLQPTPGGGVPQQAAQQPPTALIDRPAIHSSSASSNDNNNEMNSVQQQQPPPAHWRPPSLGGRASQASSGSRPGSAAAAGRPQTGGSQASDQCPQPASAHQCRICRKLIGHSEPMHLCSNCQQFICDDCASYSASDQHWMCSSCRRRALNPAIPAEALKELGLNQNSSAVRRMTLRLNQNDLKIALNKGSSESTASSSSSSGCSSMSSTATHQAGAGSHANKSSGQPAATTTTTSSSSTSTMAGLGRQTPLGRQPVARPAAAGLPVAAKQPSHMLSNGKHHQLVSRPPSQERHEATSTSTSSTATSATAASLSATPFGLGGSLNLQQAAYTGAGERQPTRLTVSMPPPAQLQEAAAAAGGLPAAAAAAGFRQLDTQQQQQQHHHQQQQQPPQQSPAKTKAFASQSQPAQAPKAQLAATRQQPGAANYLQQQQQQLQSQINPIGEPLAASHLRSSPERLGAQKTMSGPLAGSPQRGRQLQQPAAVAMLASPGAEQRRHQPAIASRVQQQQQSLRRASVNVAEQVGAAKSQNSSAQSARKMSSAAAYLGGTQSQQQQQPMSHQSRLAAHRNSIAFQQQQHHQPALMMTGTPHMDSTAHLQHPSAVQVIDSSNLMQIPPEQMHMRRLSDQSNLIRRSSIIADNLNDGTLIARNRSHSNIDSVSANYFYSAMAHQHQHQHQHRMSTGGLNAGTVAGSSASQRFLQEGLLNLPGNNDDHDHDNQQPPRRRLSDQYDLQQRLNQPQLSSIVTSCTQKRRHKRNKRSSSEEVHSTSSSDIDDDDDDDDDHNHADGDDKLLGEENHHDDPYMMNYREADTYMNYQAQAMGATSNYGQPINIPSVSVSEFHVANQRRASLAFQQQQQQQQQQQRHHQLNGGMANGQEMMYQEDNQITPMQINVAIEQEIQQQQHREQQSSLMPAGAADPTTAGFLLPYQRRGSSGRVLPKVPGEQSRSLLDLPLEQQQQRNNFGQHTTNGGSQGGLNGARGRGGAGPDAQMMLDLPSPTIRRASAPEGQNIKIVVDDMDASSSLSFRTHSAAGKRQVASTGPGGLGVATGELLERVVLYRDDSLDPLNSNNVGRGFGIQVMGGKMTGGEAGQPKLQACIAWVLPGGPADKVGLQPGDQIIEWDGKCLLDVSYEQVAEVIELSANIAELLIRPVQRLERQQPGAHYVRSQRRLSQQTERDLRRFHEQQQQQHFQQSGLPPGHQYTAANQQQQPQQQQQLLQRTGTGRRLPKIPGQQKQQQQQHQPQYQHQPTTSGGGLLPDGFVPVRHASTGQIHHSGQHWFNQQTNQLINGYQSNLLSNNNNHLGANHQQEQQTRSATELHAPVHGIMSQQQQQHVHLQQQLQPHQIYQPHGANSTLAINVWPQQQEHQPQQHQLHQQQQMASDNHLNLNGLPHYYGQPGGQPMSTSSGGLLPVASSGPDEICGLIGLQVNVDELLGQLEISVLSAINIDRNPALDYVVRVRILPESTRFKPCKTQPSADMNWKETFIFQNFPTHQAQRMALEIGIWVHEEAPRLSAQLAQPICEALIPIQSARERNTDFWPLRPPPSSPQTRRKSLNDLIAGGHYSNQANLLAGGADPSGCLPAGYYHDQTKWSAVGGTSATNNRLTQQHQQQHHHYHNQQQEPPKRSPMSSMSPSDSPIKSGTSYTRERSSSNRNLPDTSKLQVQPRRASDEMAASSSHRLMARISPAASRRSISVMNVGDGGSSLRLHSRLAAGQSGNLKTGSHSRRDSQVQIQQQYKQQQQQQQQQQVSASSSTGSPTNKYNTPTSSVSRASDSQTPVVGTTPSGRRSSLVGIHAMTGYRSQKNSQSDATDHESPLNSMAVSQKRSRESSLVASQQQMLFDSKQQQQTRQPQQQSASGPSSAHPSCSSQSGSRRGSSTGGGGDPAVAQLQRRGSFAVQTLRKLKRTMSLNKGGQDSQSGSNQESRRSSSSSDNSNSEPAEDLALSRSTKPDTELVGRLKLSFVMTKGQFEVEVICGQGLKFDTNQAIGIYVKMYLKAKSKSNKRKTKIVQPWESPVFRQTIKYDGSLVDNKLLEVSVWMKQGGLRGQIPIGFTEIRLADLNLAQLQTSWYNLRSMDCMSSSSIED